MIIACIAAFCAASIVHLIFCAQENNTYRKATKPLLMPLLALVSIAVLIQFLPESRTTLLLTVFALTFGFIGDILLINKSKTKIFIGAGSFLIGHILWAAQYAHAYTTLPAWVFIAAVIFYAVSISLVRLIVGRPRGILCVGFIIYASLLSILNFTGIAALYAHRTTSALLYLIGSLFFIVSDTMLSRTLLKSKFRQSRFFIMATYITAQSLLTCGVILPYFNN